MAALEEPTRGSTIRGILADRLVTVVDVAWYGSICIDLAYKDAAGHLRACALLARTEAPS